MLDESGGMCYKGNNLERGCRMSGNLGSVLEKIGGLIGVILFVIALTILVRWENSRSDARKQDAQAVKKTSEN